MKSSQSPGLVSAGVIEAGKTKDKSTIRALLIEDDEDDYTIVSVLLPEITSVIYKLDWEASYEAGLKAIEAGKHDVILLDYRLGVHNGLEFLEKMAERGILTPVIMLTGLDDYEIDVRAMKGGAADYLVKSQITSELLDRSIRYSIERRRIETALKKSEEKYRELVENATSIIIRMDAAGNIVFFNEFAQRFFGYSEGDLRCTGESQTTNGGADQSVFDLNSMMRRIFLDPKRSDSREMEARTRDGRHVWVSWANREIVGENGAAGGLLCVGTDVTARKVAEQALQESEERFRAMFEKSRAIKLLVDPESGAVVQANPAACEYYGYVCQDLQGMKVSRINVLPLAELREQMSRALTEECSNFFFKHRKAGGEIRDVQVHSTPVEIRGKKLLYSIVYDITNLKRVQEALRESEEKHRSIFMHSPLGIVHFDTNGVITACNDRAIEILGSSRDDLMGLDLNDFLSDPEMKSAVQAALSGAMGHFESVYVPVTGRRKTHLKADFGPILAEEGSVAGGIGIIEDITERKKAEEALRTSERELCLLSSKLLTAQEEERRRIARELHDSIGSSLNALKFSLQSAARQAEQNEPLHEILKNLVSLTHDSIQDTRRIMADLRPTILDDLGLGATIQWLCRQFREIYPLILLEENICEDVSEIVDPLRTAIFRILQEALNNIAKYSRAQKAFVTLTRNEEMLELAVEDNGVGFDLNRSADAFPRGTGHGLSGIRERVELSRGVFRVETGPGRGTRISASWPVSGETMKR